MIGFLNVDKESGKSSGYVVNRLKYLTGTPCGHMGTLDPLASGVLPVGVGKASRLFDFFLTKRKTYLATFRFGVSTDTLDSEGKITETTDYLPTREELLAAIPSLLGEVDQVPPNYSAKSIGGRRGYALARAGVDFTLPAKKVKIERISLLGGAGDTYDFEIVCGGGTYIRSIARDLAAACASLGIMTALRRTESGIFSEKESVKLDCLTKENIENYLIPTDSVLPFAPYTADCETERKLLNGQRVRLPLEDGDYTYYLNDASFYGVLTVEEGISRVRIKLC
ncbi:MAG: tRNA pseudouridine(55) synthase TruB [Clostridia bacterium]|nr:tRNA pseudouridine(55) synthase TruB [Clostridia bacterium]